jgi:hypothetical protein
MEPPRYAGDDRITWRIRPIRDGQPLGGWAVMDDDRAECLIDDLNSSSPGHSYEVQKYHITAEQWNELPEFEGW